MNEENSYTSLFFFYSPSAKEILFSSLPFESFFGSPASATTGPPFVNAFNAEDVIQQWQYCLQLKEKETHHFSFNNSGTNKNLVFDFSVLCAVLSSLHDSPGLLVHVKKATDPSSSNKSAPNYQKDYAEFIELAGHDLDAPLRKLSVLVERLVAKIDPTGDTVGYISRIQASLSDMRSMIDGLSTWASFTSSAIKNDTCDIADILRELTDHLPDQQKTMIRIAPGLPVLEGNSEQYKLLFKNLLDNAMLFSNKGSSSLIEINAAPLQPEEKKHFDLSPGINYSKIIVTDNGIGFRNEYAEKIFRPFVRLHGKSEYPGHGMGLALCKRIVEIHHGIIYAEGNTGEGARFILILPQTIT
jgi:light-regulated signal transduction histidine kinase (bacteriophytochrome)